MTGNMHRSIKKIVLAVALAAASIGLARADDSSLNPFIGDSYAYFNDGNLPQQHGPAYDNAPSTWREDHPNGLSVREMQSRWGAWGEMFHLSPTVISTASADPSFKAEHPHGLTEPEFQALSSEGPAWQSASLRPPALAAAERAAAERTAANVRLDQDSANLASVQGNSAR